ncbi:MAG: hypothetical protein QM776_04765 [Rhodocyclaceae bacterium]
MVAGLCWAAILTLLAFQALVSFKLVRYEGFSSTQRRMQLLLIWCVPLIGAWLSYSMMRASTYQARPDRQFTSQDDQSVAPGVNGGS